jgi:hypothetical protein
MNNNQNRSLLEMGEEDVMVHYAKVHLKQNDYGAKEYKNSTVAFLKRRELPLSKWRHELKLANRPVKAVLTNWSFDSTLLEHDFSHCLNRTIKYGNGGTTTRIIGYDKDARRVLTETGSIYELVFETLH